MEYYSYVIKRFINRPFIWCSFSDILYQYLVKNIKSVNN